MDKGTPISMKDRICSATFYEPIDGDSDKRRLIIDAFNQKIFICSNQQNFKSLHEKSIVIFAI